MTGMQLRQIRRRLELSQAGFARLIGSTKNSVARYERSEMVIGTPLARLVLIVAALTERGEDIEALLGQKRSGRRSS